MQTTSITTMVMKKGFKICLSGCPIGRGITKRSHFTSGATESINLAIQGSITSGVNSNKHRIAVIPVEHKAVLDTCHALPKGLAEIVNLCVDSMGRLDLEHLEQVCAKGLSLLCVMAANNEVGNITQSKKLVSPEI